MALSESTPLLASQTATPLPKFQLFILLWVQLAEPLTSQVIYPFINKLVGELPITGGEEKKIGYYAGLIESLFFVTQAFTVLQWGSLSDRVGRKPVMLIGLFGLTLSMISFGLSKSYGALVVSRCLAGVLNGNTGVIKSMMGELTDSSNIAQGMALMPVVWSMGATVGPLIGGVLANPYEQFPNTFGRFEFWRTYPYALPCFVIAFYCITSFLLALVCLKETVEFRRGRPRGTIPPTEIRHLPLREVLTPRVIVAVSNYSLLAFLDIALRALQPLFYTLHIRYGGLGFSPPIVGLCLGAFGLFSGLYQATIFVPIYNLFGTKNTFVVSVLTFMPMFALFPLMNLSARDNGVNAATWAAMTLQMILYIIMDMGFSCALIYVRSAAPSKYSLGATNGIAQTCISIVRAIGPVASTSLFSISLEKHLLGGWLVYVVMVLISALSLIGTAYLPTKLWEVPEERPGDE
ncbi:MFS general substrate transporter [Mycena venus]|uniref:MFS general substrate transporter n=1 Tax=Mycena venus TaxID=2733690 RepID=A0A8H7D6M8_9AGAR|nr:MFS general substrate transporter [Mycena venus]